MTVRERLSMMQEYPDPAWSNLRIHLYGIACSAIGALGGALVFWLVLQ